MWSRIKNFLTNESQVKLLTAISTLMVLLLACWYAFHPASFFALWNPNQASSDIPKVKERLENVRNIGLGLAGILGTFIVVWRGFSHDNQAKAANKNARTAIKNSELSTQQVAIAVDQRDLALKTQLTNRFTKALELLGQGDEYEIVKNKSGGFTQKLLVNSKLSARVGAVYALEAVSRDYLQQGDWDMYWSIVDTICNFIKINSNSNFISESIHTPPSDVQKREQWIIDREIWYNNIRHTAQDVTSALQVIGRLPHYDKSTTKGSPKIRLDNCEFINTTFVGKFNNIDFSNSRWFGVFVSPISTFQECIFSNFKLVDSILSNTSFGNGTEFNECIFYNDHFENTQINFSNMKEILFQGGEVKIDFTGSSLETIRVRSEKFRFRHQHFSHIKQKSAFLFDNKNLKIQAEDLVN
ncbi:MAG TPA: hypothetical protein DCE41_26790 [Cytophagales bacterium]|nr:hypothetical protein [Cytophagales bacterium]HAA22822.1 hypothetical protein [Cytophagales bacterium]HAP65302.1 hypothetical protein [Cytophagales bacterium]